ncbi:MAG: type IV pilus assembly protein PilM [Thermodesulfovibrionales bacterium]|nr:type IV pilus assembly protein PilM [Thermodesulfovibrionales bacterium]
MVFGKKSTIGLDMGSAYIKVAKINETKTGYELEFFDMLPIEPDVIADGMVVNKDSLIRSVKELLKKAGIKSGNATFGISGHPSVIIKKITIPLMTEDEVGASIKYEAEQYVPFEINDVNLDFQILGPRSDEEGQMDVLLVAVKKNVIRDYSEVVEKAGLTPVVVDVDTFALGNMYEVNYEMSGDNIALINVGASITNINIVRHGLPVFTRDCAIGSNYQTEALEKALDISRGDAEKLKMGRAVENISPKEVQTLLNFASDEIYAEIYRSFEYFKSSVSEGDVNKIILSGGAALIKDFSNIMADRRSIPIEIANPFRMINISDRLDAAHIKEVAPMAAVVVGLALRRIGDNYL